MTIEAIMVKERHPPSRNSRIVKAAIKIDDKVWTGWRHDKIIFHVVTNRIVPQVLDSHEQGFIDQDGFFYSRYMSAKIAHLSRQLPVRRYEHILTSEELWDVDGKPRDGSPPDPMGDARV